MIYNVLFSIVWVLMLPFFLVRMCRRGGYAKRMGDRFGYYPASLNFGTADEAIWIHAVSVGEVFVAGQLIEALRREDCNIRIVFSTTSSTGWVQAQKFIKAGDVLIYNPLDFPGCVNRALAAVRPRAIILTESEIWPNFLRLASARGIPLFLINARVSDRSAPRYKAMRWFFGEVLQLFTRIFAQSAIDAERLIAAGAREEQITVTGSFKFDVAKRNEAKEREVREWVGPGKVLVGGSTWPGEDVVLLSIHKTLVERGVKLVIVPRHFEKADAVEANIRAAGFECVRRSRGDKPTTDKAVFLADTTGEMMGFWGIADVAFVGKSLCEHGSQNMIEPCLCGVATVVGPYTENFRPVMSDLLSSHAIIQVKDADELQREITRLFNDEEARKELGARSTAAVESRRGVVVKCARELVDAKLQPVPVHKLRKVLRVIFLFLLALYCLSHFIVPSQLRHSWIYWQEDVTRNVGKFYALAAATVFYPQCWREARAAFIHVATKDLGFAKGKPYLVEKREGHIFRHYRDPDYGEVITRDDWPVKTGDRFKVTQCLAQLMGEVFETEVRTIDTRVMTMARLKGVLNEYKQEYGSYHLWCIGRHDYLLMPAAFYAFDKLLERFNDEKRYEQFAEVGIYAIVQLFACYVGDDFEVDNAFKNYPAHGEWLARLTAPRLLCRSEPRGALAKVRGSYLMPLTHQDYGWLKPKEEMKQMYIDFTNSISKVQEARRNVLRGIDAADRGVATNALELWARAAKVNPKDPLLQNIVDSLDLEGRRRLAVGDVNGALHCYENRLLVWPQDVAAVHNFGTCLRCAGHPEEAAKVFMKAILMQPKVDEHRLAFAEAASVSGHIDAATRQLEVVLKRRRDDAYVMMRLARLLARAKNPLHDEARAVQLAERAAELTHRKDRAILLDLADVYIDVGRVLQGVGLKKQLKENGNH